jgi:hypothetical protein
VFQRVPVRFLSVALVAFATTLYLGAAALPSPTLNDVLARAADATAALVDPSHRIVCQENIRQTTVVNLVPMSPDYPTYRPQQLAYRDVVASWSMTPPSPHGSGAWNEVLDVESRGPFQPFPSITALPRLTAIIDRTIDVPAPLPRIATVFLSALNQPRFEFSKVGETEVQGLTVWEVKFRETATPSLWSQPISGSFWLDPSTGRVVRSAIAVRGKAPFSDEMTVNYRLDPTTALYLPHSLTRRTHIATERARVRRLWVDTTGTFTGCRVLPASPQ